MCRCAAALLRNSSTELRYSRLCPCVYARLRFGALIRRCTQSLISVAAKSFRFRTPHFNKTIRAFSHFPSRVCFFSHLLQKKKLTQTCELFVLETGVDILSRARVRVIHRALLHCAAKCAARGSPITRRIPFASGKSFRSRTPRFNKTIRTVADFPSADRLLGCPRKIISVEYVHVEHKTKSSHKRVSFLFWKPASTRRDLRFSSPTPR